MDEYAIYVVATLYKEITLKVQRSVTTQFCDATVTVILMSESFLKIYRMDEITQDLQNRCRRYMGMAVT